MDIVVNDTNIFIDLISIDLLDSFFKLKFKVHTIDFVIEELNEEQKNILRKYNFVKKECTEEEILKVMNEMANHSGLSLTDCSVWNYARENNFTLLTGDKKLRNIAIESGVNVCDILFLFDEMVAQGIINVNVAIDKLTELYRNNTRLPKKEIDKRLELWNFFIPLE